MTKGEALKWLLDNPMREIKTPLGDGVIEIISGKFVHTAKPIKQMTTVIYCLDEEGYEPVKEEKYYLRAEGVCGGSNYLNKLLRSNGGFAFNSIEQSGSYQTQFTNEEIEQMPEWCQHLTKEEV